MRQLASKNFGHFNLQSTPQKEANVPHLFNPGRNRLEPMLFFASLWRIIFVNE